MTLARFDLKISGKVIKNSMFDRLEFIAQRVDLNPSPSDELKKIAKEAEIIE